ncbi:MAG TPA: 1-deoxy-D-xylulose-5-phosphate synthase [Dehalococcoidia bacterium]|nr:1-deoxy-D-xylulose-5-phosphate synthase [Dehalococcoidia bacterium]
MSPLLEAIDGPGALKELTPSQLRQLAAEIREKLIATVSSTGGHLASNLGVVELTLALHRVLDSPRDKIVWDVGHQSYVHKLLTGRGHRFATLRQYGGLSGFTDRAESPHDPFGAGHASTSISAALGMALARDLAGEDYEVVAVIGDGAMTGGMAFEALNHAGHSGTSLIVILNDNGMSISPTVGALSRILNQVRLDWRYQRVKRDIHRLLARLPYGPRLRQFSHHLLSGVKGLLMPSRVWERLGFNYIGPLDGHNIPEVEKALVQARAHRNKPTLIHVITTKGKGYQPAEGDAVGFHGLSPSDAPVSDAPSYSEVFADTVLRLMAEDPRIVTITAAMSWGNSLERVARHYPKRVFDVGICEQHAVTLAAGLATQGFIPIVAIYSTFLQRAFDQVLHDVCIQNLPVVFALDRAGIVGEDGKTHQGSFDLSYLSLMPNMTICAPKDENELQHLLYTAVRAGRPMAIRYPRGHGRGVALDRVFRELPIGEGELLASGTDVTLVAIGVAVGAAVEAADLLAQKGIRAGVINARFAKPLPAPLILEQARSSRWLVTVEENVLAGGFGSSILRLLKGAHIEGIKVECLGIGDEFVEQGPSRLLRARYGLDAQGIARSILSAFRSQKRRCLPGVALVKR